MKLNRLIPLIAVIFIAFSIANACNIIQSKTTEYISYCDNGDGTITVSDRWINCQYPDGIWYHCIVQLSENGTDTGKYNATLKNDTEGQELNFTTKGLGYSLVLKKVGEIEIKNAITSITTTPTQIVYTFGKASRFYYTPTITRLKEEFMLERVDVKTNKDLDVEWRIKDKSAGMEMYYDGVLWDGSKKVNADIITFKKDGITKFSFTRPFAMDSNNSFMWLKYELKVLNNKQFITLTIPQSWLETAVFPIYIDPTTNITTSQGFVIGDSYTQSTWSTTNYGTATTVNVGYDTLFGWTQAYTLLNFSSVTGLETIENALFYQYKDVGTGDNVYNETAYYCNTQFNELNITWANQDTEVNKTTCTSLVGIRLLNTTSTWFFYNITAVAQSEITGNQQFTIFQNLSTSTPTTMGQAYFSKDYTTNTSRKPYFEITYNTNKHQFFAYNKKTNITLNNFFVQASNSTFTSATYGSGSNSSLILNSSLFPTGSSIVTYQKTGYNTTQNTRTLIYDGNIISEYLYPAGLIINAVKDETTLVGLTFNVTISNSTSSVSFNSITSLDKNYTEIPNGDVTIIIANQSGGYEQRYFYLNINDYTTHNVTYYLLNNNDGLIRSFFVKDQNQNGIVGALVTIKRFIGGTWQTVATKITDSSGTVAFLMNPSTQYQVEATYQGLSSGIQTITPSESEYTLYITTGQSYTYTNIFTSVSYSISPMYLSLPRTNSTYINFSVVCTTNDLEYIRTVLTDENHTVIYDSNLTSGSGGNINANINTMNLSAVYGTFYIKRTNYALFTDTKNYLVSDYNSGNYSFFSFLTVLSQDTSMSDFTKSIISLFVTVGIMAGVVSMGIQPMGAGVVGMAIITILSIMGWFYLPALIFMWVAVFGYVIVSRGGF